MSQVVVARCPRFGKIHFVSVLDNGPLHKDTMTTLGQAAVDGHKVEIMDIEAFRAEGMCKECRKPKPIDQVAMDFG